MGEKKIIKFSSPEVIVEGLGFAESPLWHKDGFLIFSDVLKNRIMKLQNGKLETFLENSGWKGEPNIDQSDQGGANGLIYDQDGDLICCRHGSHSIARIKEDNTIETIVDQFNERRLNSPNDLCVGPDGAIYFTDPPYGLKEKKLLPNKAQMYAGVYKWYKGSLSLLTMEFEYPNGICFSHGNKYIYISSNHPMEKRLRRYEIKDGKLYKGITFAEENADGIKTDEDGNIYLATIKGILVLSEKSVTVGFLPIPEMTTNLCFHENNIFITTPQKIYKSEIKK